MYVDGNWVDVSRVPHARAQSPSRSNGEYQGETEDMISDSQPQDRSPDILMQVDGEWEDVSHTRVPHARRSSLQTSTMHQRVIDDWRSDRVNPGRPDRAAVTSGDRPAPSILTSPVNPGRPGRHER